jgi:hypothetical protein
MTRGHLVVLATAGFWAGPAAGFQDTDLEAVGKRAQEALGGRYSAKADGPKRATIHCTSCESQLVVVTIQIGRQTDGTEERVRSGQTTVADLQRRCQENQPACWIERADVGRAVGWLSTYRLGKNAGNTLVLLRDGDMLTVRSIADTPNIARENVQKLMRTVIPEIAGH